MTASVVIDCSPGQAFAYVSDYRNDPRWRSGVEEMRQDPDGPTGAGTRTIERMRFQGRIRETEARVVEFDPPHRVGFRTTSGYFTASGHRAVTAEEGGARVEYHVLATLSPWLRPLTPIIRAAFARRLAKDLKSLQALLETESTD